MHPTAWLIIAAGLAACGAGEDAAGAGGEARGPGGVLPMPGSDPSGGGGNPIGTPGLPAQTGDEPAPLPPEMEVKLDFELPQASERYVYAANPKSGTVVIIDAETLAIQTVETGDRPTFLQTLPGSNDAIVLNVGSSDATVLRSPDQKLTTSTVKVIAGANAIAVAPDGKHAVVYFNALYSAAGGLSGSFQDVTVLTLEPGADSAVGMTVGFRPREVFFAQDGSAAYAVTDDGVSVLDFAGVEKSGAGIARLVTLGQDVDQTSLDVSVTPDGRFALAREPGQSGIRLVDLGNGKLKTLDLSELTLPMPETETDADAGTAALPIEVTDLDLAPDGGFALAVLRNQGALLRIPVPAGFDDASKVHLYAIEKQLIGSVELSRDQKRALLFTTAADVERITVLPLQGDEPPRTVALRKTIEAVAIAPDGETALILHKKAQGDPREPGLDPDLMIDRSFGYSVLRLATGDVKLQVTPVPAATFTIVPDGGFVFILFRDDSALVREVQKVDAKSFLVEQIPLGSPPISLGAVPGSERVFVNQEHPDGRITLIDWKTSAQRTVTGFELNSRIRD